MSSPLLCEAVVLNLHIVIEHIAVFAECRMFIFWRFEIMAFEIFVNFFLIKKLLFGLYLEHWWLSIMRYEWLSATTTT